MAGSVTPGSTTRTSSSSARNDSSTPTATPPRTGSGSRGWSSTVADQQTTGPVRGFAPPGLPASLDYPDVSPAAILLGSARRWPDRPGWIEPPADGSATGDRRLTFAEAAARAAQFAHALGEHGV